MKLLLFVQQLTKRLFHSFRSQRENVSKHRRTLNVSSFKKKQINSTFFESFSQVSRTTARTAVSFGEDIIRKRRNVFGRVDTGGRAVNQKRLCQNHKANLILWIPKPLRRRSEEEDQGEAVTAHRTSISTRRPACRTSRRRPRPAGNNPQSPYERTGRPSLK